MVDYDAFVVEISDNAYMVCIDGVYTGIVYGY